MKTELAEPVAERVAAASMVVPPEPVPPLETKPVAVAARQSLEFTKSRHGSVVMQGVAFDTREYRLAVVDQANGPGSQHHDAAAAARARGGIAAVNGGFFTPEGKPLGLVVMEGIRAGAWNNASSLGSALWQEDASGNNSIVRRSAGAKKEAEVMRNLLQSGPLLVERGDIVGGLEKNKVSTRTFLLWDGGQRWWMGSASPITLEALSRMLVDAPPVKWKPQWALNLDGGRSSELWMSDALVGTEMTTRLPWNRPVRNFLVLVPRS